MQNQTKQKNKNTSPQEVKEFHPIMFLIGTFLFTGLIVNFPYIVTSIAPLKNNSVSVSIEEAFKDTKPILISFYSPTCSSCKIAKPVITKVITEHKDSINPVWINVNKKESELYTNLFKVQEVPELYFFNPQKMKKVKIPFEAYTNEQELNRIVTDLLSPA